MSSQGARREGVSGSRSRGRFVVLDGIDGCGKSTQAALLVRALSGRARPLPLHLREPGSTALGERLRALLLDRSLRLDAGVEALLFAAARRQLLRELVAPALEEGRDVVCERFHASTFAYQGVAGGLGEEAVLALLGAFAGEPRPDLVILLELSAERSALRRGPAGDRIEDQGLDFQRRVAEGFCRYAAREPGVARVSAEGSPEEVAGRVLAALRERLGPEEGERRA